MQESKELNQDVILTFPLKVCPWCENTPRFRMTCELNTTWCPIICCDTEECVVKPQSKTIAIRKDQRYSEPVIVTKITRLVNRWNSANIKYKGEGFRLNVSEIVRHFKEGTIGTKGHQQNNG